VLCLKNSADEVFGLVSKSHHKSKRLQLTNPTLNPNINL
jgi:hypothetical protein